jgi:UDP-glucose:(heptosyl)LPS alpha-1,3-glucosyltransferase
MATMEAMASGLPVIVSNEAGISELLTDGRDALILEDPSDREGLRETIARLMTSESLRRDLGAAARRTAEQYSWDQIVDRTLDVYQTVLAAA